MALFTEEQRPFIEAILEDPDDLTGYLVYADWMEEQGEPQAELIRVQCQMEMIERTSPEMGDLQNHERRLLAEHRDAWLGDIAQYFKKTDRRFPTVEHAFRRGFLDEIHLREHVGRFGKHLAQSECVLFLRRFWFEPSRDLDLPRWFGLKPGTPFEFPNMRRMTLLGNFVAADVHQAVERMPRLQHLDLRTDHVDTTALLQVTMSNLSMLRVYRGSTDLRALCDNVSLNKLECLEVNSNDDLSSFKDAIHLTSLKQLSLETQFGDRALHTIYESPLMRTLEDLTIRVGDVDTATLRRLLTMEHRIKRLTVRHRFQPELIQEFAERGIEVNP